ncbi:hypothetical protein EWF20_14340 [Sulfolobus sp. S-194]|uniref:hypothetical protein n=1 Tax=Sulfolobus sp. S-194 TaxID=2512240 RepID=UPI0014373688|nr:hypothetical protein [Sulfolobus sp. S-194]QIW25206.1 hypothetical protein EWF20_14340 [Sulfolobus sp. S-194]
MGYKIEDLISENGNIKRIPKGFSVIEIRGPNRVILFNKNLSILLVKVYKNIFASRIAKKGSVQYKFLTTDDEIIDNNIVVSERESIITNALDKVIMEIEEKIDTQKSKEILFYLYLIRGCLKGDKSSCNELHEQIYFETLG